MDRAALLGLAHWLARRTIHDDANRTGGVGESVSRPPAPPGRPSGPPGLPVLGGTRRPAGGTHERDEVGWADPPSEKVRGHHRDRLAVVYVRQSTLQQRVRHQESTRLQYGLVDRALGLGWPRPQVLVIDDDLGQSGTTAAGRPGFQRLVAEVGLNHVGLVLGVEMSRLARSCRDWHQLLEICGLFGTPIGDLDGIYDPTDYNDRLLLGLKGTWSEAELHVLKQRMMAGKRAKAERGKLGMTVPMGYVFILLIMQG